MHSQGCSLKVHLQIPKDPMAALWDTTRSRWLPSSPLGASKSHCGLFSGSLCYEYNQNFQT